MPPNLFELSGQVAIVTGGYGVLGGTIATGLSVAGADVILLGRNKQAAEAKAKEIRSENADANVSVVVADVTDEDELRRANKEVLERHGQIDILINAAGGNVARARTDNVPAFTMPLDAFDEVLKINLHGTVYPSLVFGESMANRGQGSIVNISSMAAVQAISGVMGYSAAKAAIDNFTRWLAVDVARKHGPRLRVNAIAPGFFITKQNRDVLIAEDGSFTDRSTMILAQTPAGRFGEPNEIVGPVVWLCSAGASFVTGTVIPVDGGFSAYSGV